jgi:parallel beta helix pectate lyase-like protein
MDISIPLTPTSLSCPPIEQHHEKQHKQNGFKMDIQTKENEMIRRYVFFATVVVGLGAAAVLRTPEVSAKMPSSPASVFDRTVMQRMGPQNDVVDTGKYKRVVYVSKNGSDQKGDGSKSNAWATPTQALAAITDAKEGNTYAVLVAAGNYKVVDMKLKPYVHLYGGFDPNTWQRDIFKNETVLNANQEGRVVVGANHARLDGLVITGGRFRGHGGAILCDDTSPEITNNFIRGNMTLEPSDFRHDRVHQSGNDGGAIAVFYKGGPRIANNLFTGNRTEVGDGAAISSSGEQRVPNGPITLITLNVFVDNVSGIGDKRLTRSSNGGAINCGINSPAQIISNIFVQNRAIGLSDAGALYCEYNAEPLVAGNWFVANRAGDDGGAIYAMRNSLPVISGNYFAGNTAFIGGPGGLRLSKETAAMIHHNVFAHNSKGGADCASAWMRFSYNTVVNNEGYGVGYRSHGGEHYEGRPVYFLPAEITHNIIYGNKSKNLRTSAEYDTPPPVMKNNFVDKDPLFVEDGLKGRISRATFDEKLHVTTLPVEGVQLEANTLAGRVIQVGGAYGVVRSNDSGTITVWGNMTKPLLPPETLFLERILKARSAAATSQALPPSETPVREGLRPQWLAEIRPPLNETQFQIFPTYQLKPGSPAQGLGATAPAEATK